MVSPGRSVVAAHAVQKKKPVSACASSADSTAFCGIA